MTAGVEDAQTVWIHGGLEVAALAILYYDYFLTLPAEIERIWKNPFCRPSLIFFLNRYVPVIGNIIVTVYNFADFASSEKTCRTFLLARQILLIFSQSVVLILLGMRVIALYNQDRRITYFVLGSGALLLGLSCWSITGGHSYVLKDVAGCHVAMTFTTGAHISIAWIAQASFDILIIVLTFLRTLQTRRFRGARGGGDLLALVWRDGSTYFAVMVVANVANIVTFFVLRDGLRGVLSTFAGCISVTMMSRLILNLYEAAAVGSSTEGVPADLTRTITMFFTTRMDALGGEDEYDYGAAPARDTSTLGSRGTVASQQLTSSAGHTSVVGPVTPRTLDWEPRDRDPQRPKTQESECLARYPAEEYPMQELADGKYV